MTLDDIIDLIEHATLEQRQRLADVLSGPSVQGEPIAEVPPRGIYRRELTAEQMSGDKVVMEPMRGVRDWEGKGFPIAAGGYSPPKEPPG
jgi:hypothetical protein